MFKLTVVSIKPITAQISMFRFAATGGTELPPFEPGAHIAVTTSKGPRQYSLITWPENNAIDYHVAVQLEDDGTGGSQAMHQLGEGDVVEVAAPENDFALVPGEEPVLLLAGGIGITPLISMATQLLAEGREFVLHYAGRSRTRMAFVDELGSAFGGRLVCHFDDVEPIDLNAVLGSRSNHSLYICGPKPMIEAARVIAEEAGFPPERIHVELFTTPEAKDGDRAFEVELASTGEVVAVAANQSIIEALEAAGHDVMYDCRRGDCGICQTDVISGMPDHRDVVLSEAEKEAGQVMQICVSRAKSDRLVLDL